MTPDTLTRQFNTAYGWTLFLVFGVPILCGCFFVGVTLKQARDDVRVWRHEFQFALDQQCPDEKIDIENGAGKVYLEAYSLSYEWVYSRTDLQCVSNGQIVRCNCATDITETRVSSAQEDDESFIPDN